jgi:hypothetical protein
MIDFSKVSRMCWSEVCPTNLSDELKSVGSVEVDVDELKLIILTCKKFGR